MLKLSSLDSNWETIAFYLIEPLINDKKRRFSRQQILKDIDNVRENVACFRDISTKNSKNKYILRKKGHHT